MDLTTFAIAVVLVVVIAFVTFRVIVRRDYRRRGKLTLFGTLMEYVAIISWVYLTYENRPPDWPAVHVGPVLEVVGSILFYPGLVFMLLGIVLLGIRRSHGQEVSRLKQTGLYGLTRNPQVVAFLLAMIGYNIIWPHWKGVVALVVLVVVLHMMVLTEEEHLRDIFGQEYEEYCRRLPRYLGARQRS